MITSVEKITPEIAKEYLRHNVRNRTVKVGEVEQLARAIRGGRFKTTHQGIAFDTDGTLIDGQQRLCAVLMANQPVELLVTKDMPKDVVSAIDRGVSRSPRDTILMSGVLEDEHEKKVLTNTVVLAAIHQLVACGYHRRRVDTDDDIALYRKLRPQINYVYEHGVLKSKGYRPCQIFAAAVAALHCGVDPMTVARFFNVFYHDDIVGCESNNVRAALNWRRQLIDNRAKGIRIDPQKIYLGTQNAIYHFANNTDVVKTYIPEKPRYDVAGLIVETIGE